MRTNPEFSADSDTFTEEILNGKLRFLCIVLCLSEIYLDSTTSFNGDDLEIPGYNLIKPDHP